MSKLDAPCAIIEMAKIWLQSPPEATNWVKDPRNGLKPIRAQGQLGGLFQGSLTYFKWAIWWPLEGSGVHIFASGCTFQAHVLCNKSL